MARMAYCGPRGIPLSTFLSWDTSDQEAALGWQSYEGRRCRNCGHHPAEGVTHAHTDVCPGCVTLETARDTETAQVKGARTHLTHGTAAGCQRCVAEIAANLPGR